MIELFENYVFGVTGSCEIGIFEFSVRGHRFDALLMNINTRHIRGFEFKSSRNDFVSDKKWKFYLDYCNTFTFVCSPETIQKRDLPKGIGLVHVVPGAFADMPNVCFYPPSKDSKAKYLSYKWISKPSARKLEPWVHEVMTQNMLWRAKRRGQDIF